MVGGGWTKGETPPTPPRLEEGASHDTPGGLADLAVRRR
jgi:hypothetical protein